MGRMLVKNATLNPSFPRAKIDLTPKSWDWAQQSLISHNRMTRLFNREPGCVVSNTHAVTATVEQHAHVSRGAEALRGRPDRVALERSPIEIDASLSAPAGHRRGAGPP